MKVRSISGILHNAQNKTRTLFTKNRNIEKTP